MAYCFRLGKSQIDKSRGPKPRLYNLSPCQVNRFVDDTFNTQYVVPSRSNMQGTKSLYLILALAASVCCAQSAPPTAQTKADHSNGTATFVSNAEIGAVRAPAAKKEGKPPQGSGSFRFQRGVGGSARARRNKRGRRQCAACSADRW